MPWYLLLGRGVGGHDKIESFANCLDCLVILVFQWALMISLGGTELLASLIIMMESPITMRECMPSERA